MNENMTLSHLDDLLSLARKWLLKNGEYNIHIEINGLYGVYAVTATHKGAIFASSSGENLKKHINKCLSAATMHKAENESN